MSNVSRRKVLETPSSAEVAAALRGVNARRVAIDGADGSGKSTLAYELAVQLGLPVLHLDDFVTKHQGAYLNHLDIAAFRDALTGAAGYVAEGICILQALAAANAAPDALVYVKRVSRGTWLDEDELDPKSPIDEHLAKLQSELQPFAAVMGEEGYLGLAEEVIRYHAEYRPHRNASVVYLRADG